MASASSESDEAMEPEPEPELESFEDGAAELVVSRLSPRDVSDLRKSTAGAEIDVFERVVMLSTELREGDVDEGGCPFTVYRMRIFTKDDRAWDLLKRFSEFIHLRQQLIANGEAQVAKLKFPRRVLWGATDPKVVEKRMVGVQSWLNKILELGLQSLGLLLLWKFLEADGTAAQLAEIQNNWRRRDKRFKALASGWVAITAAAHRGEAVRLEMLLAQQHPDPADLDERVDKFGQTALHRAAASGHTRCAVLLLSARADPSLCNEFGHSALHLAARGGHEGVFRELLRRGAPLTATDQHGNSVLHVAAQHGRKEIVHLALLAGSDLNAETAFGTTPAEVAGNVGQFELAALLGESAASPSVHGAMCKAEVVARRLLAFGPPPRGMTHQVEVSGVSMVLQGLEDALSTAEAGRKERLQLLKDMMTAMYEASLVACDDSPRDGDIDDAEEAVPPVVASEGAKGATERVTPLRLAIPKPAPWQQSSPLPRAALAWSGSHTSVAGSEHEAGIMPSLVHRDEDEESGTAKWRRMQKEQDLFLHELDTANISRVSGVEHPGTVSTVPAPAPITPDPTKGSANNALAVGPAEEPTTDGLEREGGLPLVLDESAEQRSPRSRAPSLRLSPRAPLSPRRLLSSSPSSASGSSPGTALDAPASSPSTLAGADGLVSPVLAGEVLGDVARDALRSSFTGAMAERGEQLASPRTSVASCSPRDSPQASVSKADAEQQLQTVEQLPDQGPETQDEKRPEPAAAEPENGSEDPVAVDEDEYMQMPLVARVALEAAQSLDNQGKLSEAYAQYSTALRVSVPWLKANPEAAATLKPMLSVVFRRAFELRDQFGGGGAKRN